MLETFITTLNQMLFLFVFIIAGYLLAHYNVIDKNISSSLSGLINWVFTPALIIGTFAQYFVPEKVAEYAPYLILCVAVMVIVIPLAIGLSRLISRPGIERRTFTYSFIITNSGFFGYPLVEAVFGADILLKYVIFSIPTNFFIYTVGMGMFHSDEPAHFDIKALKHMVNPPLISVVVGIIIGLLNINLPEAVDSVLVSAGGLYGANSHAHDGCCAQQAYFERRVYQLAVLCGLVFSTCFYPRNIFGIIHAVKTCHERAFGMDTCIRGVSVPAAGA